VTLEGFPQGAFLAVDKPVGPTSHDVVAAVRKIFRTREVGHAGTLDPFASGALVLLLGEATRCADLLGGGVKAYRARVRLGAVTDTDDHTGKLLREHPVEVTDDAVVAALRPLTGVIQQVPPQFSAKHVDGERAHDLARAGRHVELRAVPVEVHSLRLAHRPGPRDLDLEVTCGKGTYIRALARDLGEALGCGAHLTALRRTRVGLLGEADLVTLENVTQAHARPAGELLGLLPHVELPGEEAARVLLGQAPVRGHVGPLGWARGVSGLLGCDGRLVALATANEDLSPGQPMASGLLSMGRRFPQPPRPSAR
jgi:tRNA pseudouridine55 synthase